MAVEVREEWSEESWRWRRRRWVGLVDRSGSVRSCLARFGLIIFNIYSI